MEAPTLEQREIANKVYQDIRWHLNNALKSWDKDPSQDVQTFSAQLKPVVEASGGTFLKMIKRPFGFTFKVGALKVQVMLTPAHYSYKTIQEKIKV
jgi:hypothetical protein